MKDKKKGLFAGLGGNKKEKRSSCCCNFEIEELTEDNDEKENTEDLTISNTNSCCE
jgi:hypothetical protein